LGGGRESLPFRATWLIDVYVGVDQARQNGNIAEIENVGLSRGSIRFDDILNAFALDEDRRGPNAIGRDNLSGDEGQQSHRSGTSDVTADAKSHIMIANRIQQRRESLNGAYILIARSGWSKARACLQPE
jgi:hypothetical protein